MTESMETTRNTNNKLAQLPQRQTAINEEIEKYAQLGLVLGLYKNITTKESDLLLDLLTFTAGGAIIGTIAGSIKYSIVTETVPIKTNNIYAFTRNTRKLRTHFIKNVTGYWLYEKKPKMYFGRKILTYKAHFVFDDPYYNANMTLLLLKNNVKYLVMPCDNENGYAYYVKFPGEATWYELPLDYIPANSLKKELDEIATRIVCITADKAVKIGLPVLGLIAGSVAMASVVSLGMGFSAISQSFTIISATYSIVSNSLILGLNLSNKDYSKIVEKIPSGYLNATVGITVCACKNDEIVKVCITGSLSIVEGMITFNSPDPQKIQNIDNFLNILSVEITTGQNAIELIDELQY